MGHYIVKPTQDEDLYVMMSSVIDEPLAWGPRKRWIKWAKKPKNKRILGIDERTIEQRLDRADQMSCDSRVLRMSWDIREKIDWQGLGYVYREDLKWVCQLLELGVPIEDDLVKAFLVFWEPIFKEGITVEEEEARKNWTINRRVAEGDI
jgi:hypothetical protein